ncbi:MAG TPA: hypothetical protein VGM83_11165 [Devosiaceae bacterium]|jgi:hypothetical protein
MALPNVYIVSGMAFGAFVATAMAWIGPGVDIRAFASEMFPHFNTSHLVKFDDFYVTNHRLYGVNTEDSVSTVPQQTSTVRKIEFGRTSFVDITTTSSGTYSSDAMFSPNVRYPGVHVTPLTRPGRHVRSLAYWTNTDGWVVVPLVNASSFIVLGN